MPDEGRYSAVAREMIFSGDYITPRLDGIPFLDKPILYYWLQVIAMKLFGVTEWALRFFPMAIGILNCLITYTCIRFCFNRRTGLLAAILLASMPLYFCGAHYANLDLEVAAWISMTLLFFLTGLHTGHSRYFYLAYIASALAFLTKGMIGIAFPSLICGLWIVLTWQWKILTKIKLPLGLIIFGSLVAPWYILAQRANPAFFHFFFITQQVTRFLAAANFNNENPWWFYLPVVLAGAVPWSIFSLSALWHAWLKRRSNKKVLFIFIWFSVILLFFSMPSSKVVGYIISALPPLAILIAVYLDKHLHSFSPNYMLGYIAIAACLAATLVSVSSLHILAIAPDFNCYLYLMAAGLVASALFTCYWYWVKRPISFLATCLITNVFLLLTLVHGAYLINTDTVKPLLPQLAAIRKPSDAIINYYKFYQDIPLYLGERVLLVADWTSPNIPKRDNWVRELWYGMNMQPTHPWLIDDAAFLKYWRGKARVFVFVNRNYLQQLKNTVGNYVEISTFHDIHLVTNQPL
jgi:4-amino-4-deoxy-L-arabinose transferase-like glycosyltransferase